VSSTQIYLKELLRGEKLQPPCAVVADIQTDGIGSRDNKWNSSCGNLFLSFAVCIDELPKDLKLESASIYFAYILKETLNEFGSSVWLKWPNDFYIDSTKAGGMITNIVSNVMVCGVGLNLVSSPKGFATLDIEVSRDRLLKHYFQKIEKKISWKQVFRKYKLEFQKNELFFTHKDDLKISLNGVSLQSDGSVLSNGERIYSLR